MVDFSEINIRGGSNKAKKNKKNSMLIRDFRVLSFQKTTYVSVIVSTKNRILRHSKGKSIWDWDMNLGCREFEIYSSCVRSL